MTSYDRHASHDSPYRTGQHMPLSQSRHAPLTSIATSASESRADLTEDSGAQFTPGLQNEQSVRPSTPGSGVGPAPYSPGMRSSAASQQRSSTEANTSAAAEIQMQSFQDGLPPPPPVSHSWKKIEQWTEENYEELGDQLSDGATSNDLNELEHELDLSLPVEVRESLQRHDGQERGGRPTGIIFGSMLLDCEEIVQEWKNWRTVNEEYFPSSKSTSASLPKAFSASQQSSNPQWRQQIVERQDSQPPRAIQVVYAHPAWIPLARDWGGNNIGIDLAPGATGRWGQVILFGRDFDCKYVVARSWSAFLANVADDMQSGKVFVDEDTQELKLREFKANNVEPAYLDILRWRVDQKYGRKGPKRRPQQISMRVASGARHQTSSPYGSPTEDRGRSPPRTSVRGPQPLLSSPVAAVTRPSPLSKDSNLDTPSIRTTDEVRITPAKHTTLQSPLASNSGVADDVLEDVTNRRTSVEKGESTSGLEIEGVDDMQKIEL